MAFRYKWRPNASQRAEFARKMQEDEEFAKEYKEKQRLKNSYEGFKDKSFVPSYGQAEFCKKNIHLFTGELYDAANSLIFAYDNQEKIQHDIIHIVNEAVRSGNYKL